MTDPPLLSFSFLFFFGVHNGASVFVAVSVGVKVCVTVGVAVMVGVKVKVDVLVSVVVLVGVAVLVIVGVGVRKNPPVLEAKARKASSPSARMARNTTKIVLLFIQTFLR